MKSLSCLSLLALLTLNLQAQEPNLFAIAQKIKAEANDLYQTELASWNGTDLFLERYANKVNIGGYVSYVDGATRKCVFVSKGEKPLVIGTIIFDSTFNLKKAVVKLKERHLTNYEKDLYAIRNAALTEVNQDTMFKHYKNTNYNLIPIIKGDSKKVYILTGTTKQGEILFGNDYLLEFDKDNKILGKKRLHNSLISMAYGDEKEQAGGIHSHVLDDFITATDVCTLLLYAGLAQWKQHVVVSEKYVSMWNCQTNQLLIITTAAFKQITEQDEKKK
jgi:hypothetical protein